MEKDLTPQPPDPHMSSSDEKNTRSPLALYSEYQRMDIELRTPHAMTTSHWHGQVEVNVPFDGDVEYLINNEVVSIRQGYISLFWACTPHQLTRPGSCRQMAIFNLPMHLFLSWPLDRELINNVTHGMVIKSLAAQQLSVFEVQRWQQELSVFEVQRWQQELASDNEQIRQLAIEEIALMLKRFSLSGWQPILVNKTSRTHKHSVSRHAQFYVSQMLEFIAAHYDRALTVDAVAEHVKLNPNYAMGIFQRVMQQTMKQYITAMRINHVRALLSDTDKTILDIALTAGFRSSSRFYSTFSKYVGMPPQQYRRLSQQRRQNLPPNEA
ncbi:Melibiose operon regulatory protein [Raoultella terrigena]|uniref:Melibiose operon regulatory protein n=1 Tax=Raoultella terrigena TaxID=577 RepID=A0A7Z8ZES7_RAOTE|nr:Melibiose operon regulatory protein [Raoultella terrigena]